VLTSAFSGCVALESVSLPGSLTYLGDNAFYGLKFTDADGSALGQTVKNLRGHTFIGSGKVLRMAAEVHDGDAFSSGGISYVVTSAAAGSVSITGYEGAVSAIPSAVTFEGRSFSVESIGDSAFLRCASLTSADLSNVKALGFKALGSCAGIEHVVFGENLESIGSYALHGLSFYDGGTKLSATPDDLRGHAFSGTGGKLYLIS
ncbi:MAG: leucine-rich repeat protein, partial [Candidatus Methanomethylophilaceae archaeon]|nr:leucine-rich repeat protein [Candidatus Methanomethylophilaceae archaeon]